MPCVNPLPRPVVEKNENRYGKMKSNNQNGKKGKRKLPMPQVEVALAACLPACLGSMCVSVFWCVYVFVCVCVRQAKAVLMHCQVSKVFQSRSFKFMLHTFVCHFNCPLTFKFMPSTNRTHRHSRREGAGGRPVKNTNYM